MPVTEKASQRASEIFPRTPTASPCSTPTDGPGGNAMRQSQQQPAHASLNLAIGGLQQAIGPARRCHVTSRVDALAQERKLAVLRAWIHEAAATSQARDETPGLAWLRFLIGLVPRQPDAPWPGRPCRRISYFEVEVGATLEFKRGC